MFISRIWMAVTLVSLAALGLFVGLALLQFGNVNSSLVGGRLVVLANSTAAPFAAAARIGLPLSAVRNAAALLERARQTDDAILAIHVFDDNGRVIHSTDVPAPVAIPIEAVQARAAAGGSSWYRETAAGFLGSIDIASPGGATVGGVLISYPGGGNLIRIRAMAAELALAAIAVLMATAALSAIVLRVGLSREIRLFETIDAAVIGFERGAWRSAAGRNPGMPSSADASGLRSQLEDAEARYRTEGQALAAARGLDE